MQLQLHGKKIWLFREPINFCKSIDGLVGLIATETQYKPQEGIYLFYNKARDKVKCLSWHRNGYILLYKRLESGKFCFRHNPSTGMIEVGAEELGWLLAGLEWQKMRDWKELNYDKFN